MRLPGCRMKLHSLLQLYAEGIGHIAFSMYKSARMMYLKYGLKRAAAS